jgi:competence protein ComEC
MPGNDLITENRKPQAGNLVLPGRPLARPLVPVVLALMAGIASPAWGLRLADQWLAPALVGLWGAMVLIWWARRPSRLLPLVFFWLLGLALGQQALQPCFPPPHLVHLPQEGEVTLLGRLNRPGKMGPQRVQLFLAASAWRSPAGWRPATGRLLLTAPPLALPPVGTELVLKGRLRTPRVLKNPGTFDRPRYLAADRIFREVRLQDRGHPVFLAATEGYPLGEKLRGGIRRLLKDLDPALRAIYLAMLLGDQGEITPEMRLEFARTGTSHLLVINGMHLGMVAAVTYFLSFWLLRRWSWLLLRINVVQVATLIAVFPVVAYAWMAGGSPSTQRAEVMVLAYLLLVFLGRPREVWSALALAALVILTLAPLRLFAISFQLSFAAVGAIIYLVSRLVWGAAPEDADHHPSLDARLRPPDRGQTDTDHPPGLWGRFPHAAPIVFWGWEWLALSAVATLATAPLVAFYFQVVSLLGILVNLVAIPLVLGLALPLGEAAVLAQALSLTPVAQFFLTLGQGPLWLGYKVITLGAGLPGSAITMPIPSWAQIAAYYLFFIFLLAPRRSYLTWGGAALAGVFLAVTLTLPLMRDHRGLEVTCLDSAGLDGVAVSPEGRRLVFSARAPVWSGRASGGLGPLPGYCHWRQFRGLDLVAALTLSQDNAAELLTLARQFAVGGYWFGRRGREGPAYWDLWNYLGDRGAAPRSLERGRPPTHLGSVTLNFLQLGQERGVALQLQGEGRRALIIPPVRHLTSQDLPGGAVVAPDLLILPAPLAGHQEGLALLRHLQPGCLVLYGGSRDPDAAGWAPEIPYHFTRNGAVSVYLAPNAITVRQWGDEKPQ